MSTESAFQGGIRFVAKKSGRLQRVWFGNGEAGRFAAYKTIDDLSTVLLGTYGIQEDGWVWIGPSLVQGETYVVKWLAADQDAGLSEPPSA